MSKVSNDIKQKLLGMPIGTASNRLKKNLLFNFVQQSEYKLCFRCRKPLNSIDDFTVEHMESWQFSADPIKTFFDITNIAYSHTSCNLGAREKINTVFPNQRGAQIKITPPEGMSWCSACQQFKNLEEFNVSRKERLGTFTHCKKCRKLRR